MTTLVASIWIACGSAFAQGSDGKQGPRLDFRVLEFKTTLDKFSIQGRGIVRLNGTQFKDRIIALRVRYRIHFKNESFSTVGWSSVILTDGAGSLETTTFLPEIVMESLRAEKAFPIFEWGADGWFLMNPATIVPK